MALDQSALLGVLKALKAADVEERKQAATNTTTAGDLQLQIPKLRAESFLPSLLARRRRVDSSLFAVIMEADLHGTSTRKVDDMVEAPDADGGISKSEVSRICAGFDIEIAADAPRGPGLRCRARSSE